MKYLPLLSSCVLASSVCAETVFTIPQGYTRITIEAAPSSGQTALTSISATLLADTSFSGTGTLGNHSGTSQTLNVNSATWSTDQWTSNGAYLAYITAEDPDTNDNINAPEEAFLITGNSSNTLTLNSPANLTAATTSGTQRFPTNTTVKIRKAYTIGTIFGETPEAVALQQFPVSSFADNVFVWNGSNWVTYFFSGTAWQRDTTEGAPDPADDVIFPDEGVFLLRRGTTPIQLTLFGEVPSAPQISTIAGEALQLVASRFPVDTPIENYGFSEIEGWARFPVSSFADTVFRWNGSDWATYFHNGTEWELETLSSNTFTIDDPIPANTALFISRRSAGDITNSTGVSTPTYLPFSE